MVAGLADHVWTIREWITMPAVQQRQDTTEFAPSPFSMSFHRSRNPSSSSGNRCL